MAAKPSNTEKPQAEINSFLPFILSFGPVLMFSGFYKAFTNAVGANNLVTVSFEVVGTLLLALGLGMLLANQQRLERRLDELERLRN